MPNICQAGQTFLTQTLEDGDTLIWDAATSSFENIPFNDSMVEAVQASSAIAVALIPGLPALVTASAAYQTQAQTIASGSTYVPITYDTVVFNQGPPGQPAMWSDSANTKMVAPVTGIYAVDCSLMVSAPSMSEFCGIFFRVNGNQATDCAMSGLVVSTADIFSIGTSALVALKAGDYVEACVYNDTGADITTFCSNLCSQFSAALLT